MRSDTAPSEPEQDATDAGAIAFLRGLIGAQRHGEAAVQDRVQAALGRLGCVVERTAYEPATVRLIEEFATDGAMAGEKRETIVARLKGIGGGRSVIFFAHPDSEPVGGLERWRHDPFAGVVEGGRLHGWGVADDLAGVAAMVSGLERALADGWRPAGDIVIASTPSKRHARGVAAVLAGAGPLDAAVYLHPAESGAGLAEIKAFCSGLLEFRLTLAGRPPETREPCHTTFAHRSDNPVNGLPDLLAAIRAFDAERAGRVRHPRLEAAVGRSTNVLVSSVRCGAPGIFARVHAECLIEGSIAFPPGEAMADVQAGFATAVASRPGPARLEWISGVTGAEITADHPLWRNAAAAVAAETGVAPFVNPLHTSSDIRNPMVQKGIPTIGLGPLAGDLTQNGRHDEWVDLADHLRTTRVVARLMRAWCGC